VIRHLPVMLQAATLLARRVEKLKFLVSLAPTVKKQLVDSIMNVHGRDIQFELVTDGVDRIFQRCGFAIVASGTVSLEAAISGIPMVIIYKLSPVSYWIGRALIRVKHIGLVNLIAGKGLVPELIQGQASPQNIADTVHSMLADPIKLDKLKGQLIAVRDTLGGSGASERTAAIALRMVKQK
jgi:lipid-A-disaccharide synthase